MFNIQNSKKSIALIYFIGTLICLISIVLSSVLFSAVAVLLQLSISASVAFSSVCLGIGCFISGVFVVNKIKNRGLLNGAAISLISFIIIKTVSFLIFNTSFSLTIIFHFIICILSGILGGIFTVSRINKRKII